MIVRDSLYVVVRGWLLILAITVLAVIAALAYSMRETRLYRNSVTVFAHPSKVVSSPGDYSSDLGLLSYGSLAQTFASLAGSTSMRDKAAMDVGVPPNLVKDYTATATLLPQTTVLQISVDGPDPDLVIRIANRLATNVSDATTHYFHIVTLTSLDSAVPPSTQIKPQIPRNLLYGGMAGLVIGFILAAAALKLNELRGVPLPGSAGRESAAKTARRTMPPGMPVAGKASAPPRPARSLVEGGAGVFKGINPPTNDVWPSRPQSGTRAEQEAPASRTGKVP